MSTQDQDSGDAFGPGAREPSPQAVSALRASPPIARAELLRLLRDPPDAVLIAGCTALNKVSSAEFMAATLGGRHDLARLKMRVRWNAMVEALASAIEAEGGDPQGLRAKHESATARSAGTP